MILQALQTYYKRLAAEEGSQAAPPGYAMNPVAACITLNADGDVVNVLSMMKDKRPIQVLSPLQPKKAGSKPGASFLCEKPPFLFGIYDKPDGAAYRFQASRELHEAILTGVDDIGASAVLKFFEKRTQGSFEYSGVDTSCLNTASNVIFRLLEDEYGGFMHERPKIRAAWARYSNSEAAKLDVGQCLVTGEIAPIARLHGNVSGFGQDKPSLVSFHQKSFKSYEKEDGANAPVSQQAAFEYVTAMNALLQNRKHVVRMAGDKVLFWAERGAQTEETLIGSMLGYEPEERSKDAAVQRVNDETTARKVYGVLNSLHSGKKPSDLELDKDVVFFLFGIAANKTRVVVRFFYTSTFGDLIRRIGQHYMDIELDSGAMDARLATPFRILLETAVQRKAENIPPTLEGGLMRSILFGTPYAYGLYTSILNRMRADHSINKVRVGMIKGYLCRLDRSRNQKEGLTVALNPEETNIGYLLGRLFAVLERAQTDALGTELNSTIVDKYLNSALAAPQTVFPTLLLLFEKHVSKSQKYYTKKLVQDILGRVSSDGFPKTLNAEDQGRFTVGYYHQRQALFTKRADPKSLDDLENTSEQSQSTIEA
ncbi:MAG: type I-C CRISPR-associated protein Cas8c/Csd1 [Oscillospiraceae bacterium]|jgi:CRISPR-associated protein Csd1|nr:type I-C CRISPR-associated protein Cas8c/Csd1 [Oscillospiraceae bacterium]